MIGALRNVTYMVRHNPNCPKPFEVRLCGDAGRVSENEPRNAVGYGMTVNEAAGQALKTEIGTEIGRKAANMRRRYDALFGQVWTGDRL